MACLLQGVFLFELIDWSIFHSLIVLNIILWLYEYTKHYHIHPSFFGASLWGSINIVRSIWSISLIRFAPLTYSCIWWRRENNHYVLGEKDNMKLTYFWMLKVNTIWPVIVGSIGVECWNSNKIYGCLIIHHLVLLQIVHLFIHCVGKFAAAFVAILSISPRGDLRLFNRWSPVWKNLLVQPY